MLCWRNLSDLDQIIQEREKLVTKDGAEINQSQKVHWMYIC